MNQTIENTFNDEYNISGQVCFIRTNPIKSLFLIIKSMFRGKKE